MPLHLWLPPAGPELSSECSAPLPTTHPLLPPAPQLIHNFALKHVARELAEAAGVPVLKGSGLVTSTEAAAEAAEHIGFPVLLKATGGGGGRGIYICNNVEEVLAQFATSQKQVRAGATACLGRKDELRSCCVVCGMSRCDSARLAC